MKAKRMVVARARERAAQVRWRATATAKARVRVRAITGPLAEALVEAIARTT